MLYAREVDHSEKGDASERERAIAFLRENSGIEKVFFRGNGKSDYDESWKATTTIGVFGVSAEGCGASNATETLLAVLKFAAIYPSGREMIFATLKNVLKPFDPSTGHLREKWIPKPVATVTEFAVLNSLPDMTQRKVMREGVSHIFDMVVGLGAVNTEVPHFDERGERLCRSIGMMQVGEVRRGVHSQAADSSIWRIEHPPF